MSKLAATEEIRRNPIRTLLVTDENGAFLGEITPLNNSAWRACRYGSEYKKGGVVVPSKKEAERYILESRYRVCTSCAEQMRRDRG
jgi:hypothetical protein